MVFGTCGVRGLGHRSETVGEVWGRAAGFCVFFFDPGIHEKIWRKSGEELVNQRMFMTYPTGVSSVNRIVNWIGSWRR